MKLVAPNCPRCGAPLVITRRQTDVTCGYCKLTCAIEREAPPADPRDHRPLTVYAPTVNPMWIIGTYLALGGIVLVALGVAWLCRVFDRPSSFQRGSTSTNTTTNQRLVFLDRPMLADANGDGHPDVIGKCATSGVMNHDFIAALDGKTGAKLWAMPPLTAEQQSRSAVRAVVADKLVLIDELAVVRAYRLTSGALVWSAKLSDRPEVVCQNEGQLVVRAKDDSLAGFNLDSGKKQELPRTSQCRGIYSDKNDHTPEYGTVDSGHFADAGLLIEIDGMSPYHALVPTHEPIAFLYGSRSKGTSVAMVAAVSKGRVLWKTLVPGIDPLRTSVNQSNQEATYVSGRLVLPYEVDGQSSNTRIAAFDAATGRRLWDVPVHQNRGDSYGISSCSDTVYYAAGMNLYAIDLADGRLRFRVGTAS